MRVVKIINAIILVAFFTYWGAVFFSFTQGKTQWWNDLYTRVSVHSLMPPVYRMYTSPPKSQVFVRTNFYAKGKLLGVEDSHKFFKNYRKDNFLTLDDNRLMHIRDVYGKALYYGVVNNMYDYYEMQEDSLTMQDFLLTRVGNEKHFNNQKLLPKLIQQHKLEYKKADSFQIFILRYPIVLEIDGKTREKFSYWIKDTLAYKANGKL